MESTIKEIFDGHQQVFFALQNDRFIMEELVNIARASIETFRNGGKLLFCGNGGSAADAQHIASEMSGQFNRDRDPLYAEALHVNSSYMTSVSNDYGFEYTYARLVEGMAKKGDILFGLSTSGNSVNVLNAIKQAKHQEVLTVALTGQTGGKLGNISDLCIRVPSTETPRIQEMHIVIGHILCELVEKSLFGD
jgi:D-sedoheptulose 7-phosphate isomerase